VTVAQKELFGAGVNTHAPATQDCPDSQVPESQAGRHKPDCTAGVLVWHSAHAAGSVLRAQRASSSSEQSASVEQVVVQARHSHVEGDGQSALVSHTSSQLGSLSTEGSPLWVPWQLNAQVQQSPLEVIRVESLDRPRGRMVSCRME
jgi:hypothetical protein